MPSIQHWLGRWTENFPTLSHRSPLPIITLFVESEYRGAYLSCSLPYRYSGADYVQMPGQGRLKDRLTNKFNHLHSLVPTHSRSPSPNLNRQIRPTLDPQASSTPIGPDLLPFMKFLIHKHSAHHHWWSSWTNDWLGEILISKCKDDFTVCRKGDRRIPASKIKRCRVIRCHWYSGGVWFSIQCCGCDGVDRPQTTAQNQQDRQDLEQKLRAVFSVINNHAKYSIMFTFTKRLEGLSS